MRSRAWILAALALPLCAACPGEDESFPELPPLDEPDTSVVVLEDVLAVTLRFTWRNSVLSVEIDERRVVQGTPTSGLVLDRAVLITALGDGGVEIARVSEANPLVAYVNGDLVMRDEGLVRVFLPRPAHIRTLTVDVRGRDGMVIHTEDFVLGRGKP